MMTLPLNQWKPFAGYMSVIDLDSEALAAIRMNDHWNIVRKTADNQFAVMTIRGAMAKVVKVLPTLDRARSYNFAISK